MRYSSKAFCIRELFLSECRSSGSISLKKRNSLKESGMISRERLRPRNAEAISLDNTLALEPVIKIFLESVS